MARLFSRFLVKGDDTPFVMELPPYRMPTMKSIFRHTWEKGAQYLKKMGGIIMIASIIIWFLGYYPDHDAYPTQAEQQENSYIGQIGQAVEPVLKPLGFDWKLSIGLLSGVGAKELVVSTLGVLYTNDADADVVSLAERIPITPLAAFSYMLFVLIYFPCIATLVAIKQESGSWKWAIFTAGYTTALAWLVSFAVYQIGGMFYELAGMGSRATDCIVRSPYSLWYLSFFRRVKENDNPCASCASGCELKDMMEKKQKECSSKKKNTKKNCCR